MSLTVLRGFRKGKLVRFDFEDMGEVQPGVFLSRFQVDAWWVTSSSGGNADVRLAHDLAAMAKEGYDPASIEYLHLGLWHPLVGGNGMSGPGGPHLSGVPFLASPPPFPHPTIMPGQIMHAVPPPMILQPGAISLLKADPRVPDTLGFREWVWSIEGRLISPVQHTPWPTAQMTAETWTDEGGVRGTVGIHAHFVPKHWKAVSELSTSPGRISGIVERFGRYVLGTEGWRAEQAIIRELMAPSTEIGLKLEQAYPDVIVHYPDQTDEGEFKWTSEKSCELERGSRSLLPSSLPAPASSQSDPPSNFLAAQISPSMALRAQAQSQQAMNMILSAPPSAPRPKNRDWEWIVTGMIALGGLFSFFHLMMKP